MTRGEWFKDGETGLPMLIVTAKDEEGDARIALLHPNGEFETEWRRPELCTIRLKRAPWVVCVHKTLRRNCCHKFEAFCSPDGKSALIVAGCRSFSIRQAKDHWSTVDRGYISSQQNEERNAWSLQFVVRVEAEMRSRRT